MKKDIYQIENPQKLKYLAEKILKKLDAAHIVLLNGELGSGKTALAQAIAKKLNIKNKITSPSFVLMKIYPLRRHKKFQQLCHVDLYRSKKTSIRYLTDYINNPQTLTIIEWPNNLTKKPLHAVKIKIKVKKNNYRFFTVRWP